MTVRRVPAQLRGLALAGLPLAVLALAACVIYPTVRDAGGVRFKPENARAVRLADRGAVFYADLASTGKYGDTLLNATAAVARRAQLVSEAGQPVDRMEIPGESVFRFRENGPRIVLSELTRSLAAGEVIIVTLHFVKYGSLGVVTVVE